MIIYGNSVSPFVRKTLAFARHKGIAFENKQIGLGSDDPDFLAASPFRKIPALKDGDYMLADSSAICHYIEAMHPEPALIPADPQARGKVVWFDEFADTIVVGIGGKVFFNRVVAPKFLRQAGDTAAADTAEHVELPPILDWLEKTVPEKGYLVGDALTLADLAVASPFVNLSYCCDPLDDTRHPRLVAYVERILAEPCYAPIVEAEGKFMKPLLAA